MICLVFLNAGLRRPALFLKCLPLFGLTIAELFKAVWFFLGQLEFSDRSNLRSNRFFGLVAVGVLGFGFRMIRPFEVFWIRLSFQANHVLFVWSPLFLCLSGLSLSSESVFYAAFHLKSHNTKQCQFCHTCTEMYLFSAQTPP